MFCIDRRPSLLCEMSAIILNCATNAPRWFCDTFKNLWKFKKGNFTSPLNAWMVVIILIIHGELQIAHWLKAWD